jgi:hypothetical protein
MCIDFASHVYAQRNRNQERCLGAFWQEHQCVPLATQGPTPSSQAPTVRSELDPPSLLCFVLRTDSLLSEDSTGYW